VDEHGSDDWRGRLNADGFGVRGFDERRTRDERRRRHRHGKGRRKGDRRRAGIRTLLLTAAALSAPHAAKIGGHQRLLSPRAMLASVSGAGPEPSVEVAINSFDAVEARHAYDDIVGEAAAMYKLDPRIIKAVMEAESAFNAMAVSPVGALGLMQLMPEVAKELGVTDPLAKYLKQLLDAQGGNVRLALASYNAGPGNVAKYGAIPPFKETRNYVKKVTALLAEGDD
jgi:soluble lytic murein transglycosylase-like protein